MQEAIGPFRSSDLARLPDAEGRRRWELIEGELFVSASPAIRHQRVLLQLVRALATQVEDAGEGFVLMAPVDVVLSDVSVLIPDLVVVKRGRREVMTEDAVEGPPDLVVEVLSPSTRSRDLKLKRRVYERYKIPEYWVAHPKDGWAEVLTLQGGAYVSTGRVAAPDVLRSAVFPNVAIPLQAVFARP